MALIRQIVAWYKNHVPFQDRQHLDKLLFKRGVALLTSSPAYLFWFSRTIRLPLKIAWLRQLTVLVQSGVLLPDALTIVADQLNHPVLQE